MTGKEYYKDGIIDFGEADRGRQDLFYRTVYGWGTAHNGKMISRSDKHTSVAFRRLSGKREPEKIGLHEELKEKQTIFVRKHWDIFRQVFEKYYYDAFNLYTNADDEAENHHADPHEKRKARIHAWNEANDTGERYATKTWVGRSVKRRDPYVTGKMKPQEFQKPEKKTRMIIDIGIQGSLAGFRLAEFLKQAQTNARIELNGGLFIFVKSPDPVVMEEVFTLLQHPPGRFVFVYFSDDSVFSYWHEGRVVYCNIDISSCDISHTPALFELFELQFPERVRSDAHILVEQCTTPIRVRSLEHFKRSVLLRPLIPKLFSGSTITTPINNLASFTIGYSFSLLDEITPESMTKAAADAGYIVTGCEGTTRFEDLQFLKHSPVCTKDGVRSVFNVGPLLRASGTCKFDLPGRGPLEPRARSFQKALLNGMYPYITCPFLACLKAGVADAQDSPDAQKQVAKQFARKVVHTRELVVELTDQEFFSRYQPDVSDFADLYAFARSTYGESSNFNILDKILYKDYQMHTIEIPVDTLPDTFTCASLARA